jgi:AraC family transcriptional regulator of adaptative response/methylated-DNA-[protein]-cysteine methyltransferase
MLETQFSILRRRLNATIIQGPNPHFTALRRQLGEYFEGKRTGFDLPIETPGTPFEQRVWKELQRIPYGSTRSYKRQATALGSPAAVRAVANANGRNRIAIIIPCHRVIGEDGHLTGYGGGLWRKQWLLDLERKHGGPKS